MAKKKPTPTEVAARFSDTDDASRGTGRTSQQMLNAPPGAWYMVPDLSAATYFRELAKHVGRDDLKIISPIYLDFDYYRLKGRKVEVIIDHGTLRSLCSSRTAALHNYRMGIPTHFDQPIKSRTSRGASA
jgi:hypothetical protein